MRVTAFGCVPDSICKVRNDEVISSNQVREIGRRLAECKADFAAVLVISKMKMVPMFKPGLQRVVPEQTIFTPAGMHPPAICGNLHRACELNR